MFYLKKYKFYFLLSIGLFFLFTSCNNGKYSSMLAEAQSSGIQTDSLMLGIRFGISQDSFFNYCKKLNQEKEIFDSGTALRVARKITWDNQTYQMNFYPKYKFDEMNALEFEIFHHAYSTWNKQYTSENLIPKIKAYFENAFQIQMQEFDHEKFGKAFVAFTGNRRLRIFRKNQKTIGGEFLDMTEAFNQ